MEKFKIYTLCGSCNQEYPIFLGDNLGDKIVVRSECPFCKHRNELWLRIPQQSNKTLELDESTFRTTLEELAKESCMLHRTSEEVGFIVIFDLNDLVNFSKKVLESYGK